VSAPPIAATAGDVPAVLTALFVVLLAAKPGDELFKRLGQPGIVGMSVLTTILIPPLLRRALAAP
jgi:Kef-type K+ transport system membrane component KefB